MRINFSNILTIFFLIFLNFIHSVEGNGEKECFADMLVLHSPNVGQLSMKMDGKKFVFRKIALSTAGYSDMQKILNHPESLKELWECLKKHNTTGTIDKMPDKTILMNIYEIMLLKSGYIETFPLSQELQGKYHNAQCYMDLMVIEGKLKLESPELITTKYPIDTGMIHDFLLEKVSPRGAAFMRKCILKDEPLAIAVVSKNYLHLHHENYHELNGILQQIPHSNQLIMNIKNELHGLAKVLIENFVVNTETMYQYSNLNIKEKEYRSINKRSDTPERIHKSHDRQLFDKLKQFIYRKVAFLKRDQDNHDEYVDIEEIFSQGQIVVDDKFKGVLDKQSDCLVEFLYSKCGVEEFHKIIVKPTDALYQRKIEYVFHKNTDTDESFLLVATLEISSKLWALGNYVFVDGINDEFAVLKQCGVEMSIHNHSYDIFDVHQLIDAYDEGDMFLRKIKIPKNYKVPANNNTDCPICLATFADDEHVARLPCHHFFHQDCINTWMSTQITCPICRANVTKTKHVIVYSENGHHIRHGVDSP